MPDQTETVPRSAEAAVAWILRTVPAEYQDDARAAMEDIVRDGIGFGVDSTDRHWNGEALAERGDDGATRVAHLATLWAEQQL